MFRDALRLFELATNATAVAVIGTDSNGLVQFWSSSSEQILGWSGAEMIGQPLPFAFAMASDLHSCVRTKHGHEINTEFQVLTWNDASGEPQGKLCVLRDVTLQMKEQDVARSARRFRELLEAAPDAILEIDRQGKIVLANAIAGQMFGYPAGELMGRGVEDLLPQAKRAGHTLHRDHFHATPSTRSMGSGLKLDAVRRNGDLFPVEISLSPADSEDGQRVTAIIRDISDRRASEEKLLQIRERFARELAVKNEELQKRNQAIERSDRLKSEFLASMSHELRTPLHTIIGFTELLAEQLQGPLNEKQTRFVDHILRDSLHLLEVINEILDLSKIESGRLVLRRGVFQAVTPLEEALASIHPSADSKSIALTCDVSADIHLFADRLRFKEILLNLLSNAVKFTPEHGRVHIAAELQKEGSGFCQFTVSDTGIGIARDEHDAIFDKFYQAGATTRGVREGTGLGLAITRHLVEEHGGRVWLESEPGSGSRFFFTIPVEQALVASEGAS